MSREDSHEEAFGGTRRDMQRAIRRFGVLETVVLGLAMILAMVGGAVLAGLLSRAGLPFRTTWVVCSVLLFAVPAVLQLRMAGGTSTDPRTTKPSEHDDGR